MLFPLHDDNPTKRTPTATYALIAINVAVYLWMFQLPQLQQQVIVYRRGFMPARIGQLTDPNKQLPPVKVFTGRVLVDQRTGKVIEKEAKLLPIPPIRNEILLSLLSCMFLHGGFWHLAGNMWFLWLFGNNVEDRLGPGPFLIFYLLGGLLGSGCHWMQDPGSLAPLIGASGAVATVLGAYAVTWPWARVHSLLFLVIFVTIIDLPALFVLGGWFLLQIWEANKEMVGQPVAWWAHVGGFIAGMILMPLLSSGEEDDEEEEPQPVDIVE